MNFFFMINIKLKMSYAADTKDGNNSKKENALTYSGQFSTQIFPSAVITLADETLPLFLSLLLCNVFHLQPIFWTAK